MKQAKTFPLEVKKGLRSKVMLGFLVLVVAGGVSILFPPALQVSAASLFSDGFESGDFGVWSSVGPVWNVQQSAPQAHSGEKRGLVHGVTTDSILLREQSTTGFDHIVLSYWYRVEQSIESSDHVRVEWSVDGTTWTRVHDITAASAGSWIERRHTLPASAENAAGFRVRFRATLTSSSGDRVAIDDVSLSGEPAHESRGSIKGSKFNDKNGDGDQDGGESRMPGWTISLSDPIASSTATDASGNYIFRDLPDGIYTVCEVPQNGWTQTAPSSGAACENSTFGYSVALENGSEENDVDFGNVQYARLTVAKNTAPAVEQQFEIHIQGSGSVNGSSTSMVSPSSPVTYVLTEGTYSVSESPAFGWTLVESSCGEVILAAGEEKSCTLTNEKTGSITVRKTTDPSGVSDEFSFTISGVGTSTAGSIEGEGSFVFDSLRSGTYALTEILPIGWDFTSATCGDSSFQNGGTYFLGFGEHAVCTFTNKKRSSITVTKLADPDNGPFVFTLSGPSNPEPVTFANGRFPNGESSYTFGNLLPGDPYMLQETLPEGWSGQATARCTLGEESFLPEAIRLPPGSSASCVFNNTQFGLVSGKKFHDLNMNGRDDNEPGLPGWTIALAGDEEFSTTTVTDSTGSYNFEEVLPGMYTVCEMQQDGWYDSYPKREANCPSGYGYEVTLSAGENVSGKNFGNYQKGSISGIKFDDANANGSRDEAELGLAGWTIELYEGTGDEKLAETQTGESGSYIFENLLPESYKVKEVWQSGWTQTAPINPTYYSVILSSGELASNTDFGNTRGAGIGGNFFWDLNADGARDESGVFPEPSLEGWRVALGTVGETASGTVPIEIVSLGLTDAAGRFIFPIDAPGRYRLLEERRPQWQETSPIVSGTEFNVTCAIDGCSGDMAWNENSYFDVFIANLDGQETTTAENGGVIQFGNVRFEEVLGLKMIPLSGNPSSTPQAKILENGTVSIVSDNGTSTISLAAGTFMSVADGIFNVFALSAGVSTIPLSGFASGTVLYASLAWGIPGVSLEFSPPVSFAVAVGADLDGQTLAVMRSSSSEAGWTTDGISGSPCLVVSGSCNFTAIRASYYAITSSATSSSSGDSSNGEDDQTNSTSTATSTPPVENSPPVVNSGTGGGGSSGGGNSGYYSLSPAGSGSGAPSVPNEPSSGNTSPTGGESGGTSSGGASSDSPETPSNSGVIVPEPGASGGEADEAGGGSALGEGIAAAGNALSLETAGELASLLESTTTPAANQGLLAAVGNIFGSGATGIALAALILLLLILALVYGGKKLQEYLAEKR